MSITFAIPTWNRAEKLERCVQSILAQSPDGIVIADNASDDGTKEVCMRLADLNSCIKYVRYEEHVGFAESYRRAVLNVEGDGHTWTFGDDDMLEESALNFIKGVVRSTDLDFYHVAESTRVGDAESMVGTVLEICCAIGFIDFTGFISGNIGRSREMRAAVNSPNYGLYSTCSFPQSLGIMETMAHSPAMMLELGCVETGKPDDALGRQWASESTCWKYLFVSDGLKRLQDMGMIPKKLPEVFFRYLEENLFSRMMRDFNGMAVMDPLRLIPREWECFVQMAEMVAGDRGDALTAWIKATWDISEKDKHIYVAAKDAYMRMSKVTETMPMPIYPFSYLPSRQSEGEPNVEA